MSSGGYKGMCADCTYMRLIPAERTMGRSKKPIKYCMRYNAFCQPVDRNCPGPDLRKSTLSKGEKL